MRDRRNDSRVSVAKCSRWPALERDDWPRNVPYFAERQHKLTESIEQYHTFFDRLRVRTAAREEVYKELLNFRDAPEKWTYLRRGTRGAWLSMIEDYLVRCRSHILNSDNMFEDEVEKDWAENSTAVCDT